jgi:hypothetical protein
MEVDVGLYSKFSLTSFLPRSTESGNELARDMWAVQDATQE